jgi:hypothetical protein
MFSGFKTMPVKTSLVECLLRYYDFIDSVEQMIVSTAKTKGEMKCFSKKTQGLLKQISLGKQKLLFYLCFIKSGCFDFKLIADEFEQMYLKIKESKLIGSKYRELHKNNSSHAKFSKNAE